MRADFPDSETIRTVLTVSTRAPSVHNSQPWRWRVGPDRLHLYADASRHLSSADPDRREQMLSCGAALHHCAVGFAAAGWQAKIERLPDPADIDHLAVIELVRQPAGELDVTLADAIARRRTDRRNFSSWPVPWGDIALMGARAARVGVMLRQIDLTPRIHEIVAESVSIHAADADYLAELRAWSGRYGAVAGVPARNAVDPDLSAPIPARAFAGPALHQPTSARRSPHGDLADGSILGANRELLASLQTRTLALKRDGKTVEAAGKQLVDEFKAQYPAWDQPIRVLSAVEAVYRENPWYEARAAKGKVAYAQTTSLLL